MIIAQADSTFWAWYGVYIVFSILYAVQVFLVYFVIWTRKDWISETRVATTIAVTLGIWFPPFTYVCYSIADVVSRRKPSGGQKTLWIVAIVFLPGIGVLAYLIWALQGSNRPDGHTSRTHRRSLDTQPETRASGAMTSEDLDYLQKLADLHEQGVLNDDQYEAQRRQRLGE